MPTFSQFCETKVNGLILGATYTTLSVSLQILIATPSSVKRTIYFQY